MLSSQCDFPGDILNNNIVQIESKEYGTDQEIIPLTILKRNSHIVHVSLGNRALVVSSIHVCTSFPCTFGVDQQLDDNGLPS